MKQLFTPTHTGRGRVALSFIVASLCILCTLCTNKTNILQGNNTNGNVNVFPNKKDSFPGVVIWTPPGTPSTDFDNLLKQIKSYGTTNIVSQCESCDNSLMLLNGPGPQIFIQHQPVPPTPPVSGTNGLSGQDGQAYYSLNFPVDFDDSTMHMDSTGSPASYVAKDSTVVVAVFDSGVDPGWIDPRYFYQSAAASCLTGSNTGKGWNFPAKSSNWKDDNAEHHGTLVSKLIIDESNSLPGSGASILPVKIVNTDGTGHLFDVLCGFSYAAQRGAKIINASFGYYAMRSATAANHDYNAVLLKAYIHYYLTQNNILLVAAAGNYSPSEASVGSGAFATTRDLDQVSFYPASLAGDPDLPNVIAVTTVRELTPSNGAVSPLQNYSNSVVDAGVNAQTPGFEFLNPFFASKTIVGSSFATPIITGLLCANYSSFNIPAQPADKRKIIPMLISSGQAHINVSLLGKIVGGTVVYKANPR